MAGRGHPVWIWAAALLLAGTLGVAGRAGASAWNRPAGTGLAIFGFDGEAGSTYYDPAGRPAPARAFSKQEASAYVEYGATDWLTVIARPTLDRVAVGAPDGGRYAGFGGGTVGAQWQALVFGPARLAVQGSLGVPARTARDNPALDGSRSREAELRALGGVSLPLPFRPFIDLEGAFRARSGGAADQWRADLTAGLYPTDKLLVLVRSSTLVPTGRADPRDAAGRSTRVDLEGVYALSQDWAIQAGAFRTAWERGSLRERGVTLGLWRYF